MKDYQREFIEFLVRSGVLTFGDFTTKSGRKTPYFINTGNYRTGGQLARLGDFYASRLVDALGEFDNLYGPAYKGIPLAVTTAIALEKLGRSVTVTYNRKEAKDHGEGGSLIGHKYVGGERVVIVEDVITAGTSIRETMAILAANKKPQVAGAIVSVDRMERGQADKSAIQEVAEEFGFPVVSIVTVRDVLEHLHGREVDGKVLVDDAMKGRIEAYLAEYGVA